MPLLLSGFGFCPQNHKFCCMMLGLNRILSLFILLVGWSASTYASPGSDAADSWESIKQRGTGAITVLWYPIEPLVYTDRQGRLTGLEHDLMTSLVQFAEKKYGVYITVNWVKASSFAQVYDRIRNATAPGLFGWSYFSITDERKQAVQFTPSYMPDLNVLITHHSAPLYQSVNELSQQLSSLRGYAVTGSTMEEDLLQLRKNLYPALPLQEAYDDYAIMQTVANDASAIGYVPLPVYILGIQKGFKVKRQHILPGRRQGFAGILPRNSDWHELVQEYFASAAFRETIQRLLHHYFGPEITRLAVEIAEEDSLQSYASIELLSLEKEIVTRKLMNETVELQRQKWLRNMVLLALAMLAIIAGILYNRFRVKQRLTKKLEQRNRLISEQSRSIENMNRQLRLKMLQTRLNPHFLFNSLNAIQYFVMTGDRKQTLQYIHQFSGFLRKVIRLADENRITAEEEAAICTQYLWLEQSRFPDRFDYSVTISPGVTREEVQVPPLMTLSLIEEALYKGILDQSPSVKGTISVAFNLENHNLHIDVYGQPAHHRANGTATEKNVLQSRLDILNESARQKISLVDITAAEAPGWKQGKRLVIPQTHAINLSTLTQNIDHEIHRSDS